MSNTLPELLACLKSKRFDLSNEKALQSEIKRALLAANIIHVREVALSPEDIIDFLVDTVGVEVKIKGAPRAIYRQCVRYCNSPRIEQLLLITNKAIQLPPTINGKPTHVLNLGLAWL